MGGFLPSSCVSSTTFGSYRKLGKLRVTLTQENAGVPGIEDTI